LLARFVLRQFVGARFCCLRLVISLARSLFSSNRS